MKLKYKKVSNNENAIEIDGKVVLSFDSRYKEYLKWREKNPDKEERLLSELKESKKNRHLYNDGAPHKEENNVRKWYNERGNLVLEAQVKGKIDETEVFDGYYKKYSEDGKLLVRGFYNQNDEDNVWTWNYPTGEKMTEKVYTDKVLCKVSEWYEDGTPISVKEFNGDELSGKTTLYDDVGNITSIKTYKNSKLSGKYIEYYTSTKKRSEGTMQYNMMQDKWTFWYHNGEKELECEFEFGEPIGTAKLWNDNGKRRFTYDLGSWNDEV